MKKLKVKAIVSIGMLSGIAVILQFLNFPIPPFPNFLLVDFSDIPALFAAMIFGPIAGILVEFIKNVLNYFTVGSATGVPVGQIANFIAGILFILPTYYLYKKLKTRKGMTFALVIGSLTMGIIMSILNYFVFMPAYTFFLNYPAMSTPVLKKLVVSGILPFNIIKGFIMSAVFFLLFVRMQSWFNKQAVYKRV